MKAAAQCYSDTPGQEAPGSALLIDPNVDSLGPPPPPPYTDYAPTKLNGSYDSGSDTLTMTGCFANVGGTIGPNMIAEITITDAKAGLASSVLTGTVDLFEGQTIASCDGKTPKGAPDADDVPINLYRIASLDKTPDATGAAASPLRPSGLPGETATDYDGDGCNDDDELDKQRPAKPCGDDPYNPHDSDDNYFGSNVTVLVTLRRADVCQGGLPGAPAPGAGAGGSTAGISMGDVDATHVAFTGTYDKGTNELLLEICYDNVENPLRGPNFYLQATIDAHTGQGLVDVWFNRPDCAKPAGPPDAEDAAIQIAKQDDDFDFDQDACTTRTELGSNQFQGGGRDPFSKFDKIDINKDGITGIPDDILPVAARFGVVPPGTQGDVGPRMAGSNLWMHRSGDGVINIPDDIFGVAFQFGHNCF